MIAVQLAEGRPGSLRPVPADTIDDLLVAVAHGDRGAFDRLYDRVAGTVFGVAKRVLVDPHRAQEVAQDVLVEVWRRADRFDPSRGSALAWIATMTRRRAIDVVRAEEASRRRETDDPASPEAADPVAENVVQIDERHRVRSAVGRLTDLQREAVELAFYGGLTHRQIADRLGIPLGTVKTRIRDGLLRLGTMMETDDG